MRLIDHKYGHVRTIRCFKACTLAKSNFFDLKVGVTHEHQEVQAAAIKKTILFVNPFILLVCSVL